MQTLVAGNPLCLHAHRCMRCAPARTRSNRQTGFTLLELLVVIAIIAIATAGVSLALRDSSTTALEREAQRLAAVLDAGRSQSRTTGLPIRWQPVAGGFVITSNNKITDDDAPQTWLTNGITAQSNATAPYILLGPEPIIAPQRITLLLEGKIIDVATDGLQPFRIGPNAPSGLATNNATGS